MKNLMKTTYFQPSPRLRSAGAVFVFKNLESIGNADDFKLDLADLKSEVQKTHDKNGEYINSLSKNEQEQQNKFDEKQSTENLQNEIDKMKYDFDGVFSNEKKSSEAFVKFVIREAKKLNIKVVPPNFLTKYLGKYENEFTKIEGDISYRAPGNYATLGDLGMMIKKMGAIGYYNGETSKEINKSLDKRNKFEFHLWQALLDLQKSE